MNIRYPIYEGVYRILTTYQLSPNRKPLHITGCVRGNPGTVY